MVTDDKDNDAVDDEDTAAARQPRLTAASHIKPRPVDVIITS